MKRHSKEKVLPLSLLLRTQGKSNDVFEAMLSALSFDDLIGLKLECTVRSMQGKCFGFPLFKMFPALVKEGLYKYAKSATLTDIEAAMLLGVSESYIDYLNVLYSEESILDDSEKVPEPTKFLGSGLCNSIELMVPKRELCNNSKRKRTGKKRKANKKAHEILKERLIQKKRKNENG